MKTQEALIQELTSQLANVKALAGSEKSYMLHFLTREAADAEKDAVQKEVGRWKDIAKQKDAQLAAKDKRISEMQEEEKNLRAELNAEIERGKSLASKNPPPSVNRHGAQSAQDPKQGIVTKLYEDLTNVLVMSVKLEKSEFNLGLSESTAQCLYSFPIKPGEDTTVPSLSFTLRRTWVRPDDMDPSEPITSKDQLEEKVRYQPLMLEQETPKFVEALEFFREPFLFSSNQMPVFLKTLTDKMTSIQESYQNEEDEDEDEDDDVVEIVPTGK